jgi:hypothetical protein
MSKVSKFIGAAKKALTKKNKFVDYRGLNTKKSYSSFWMDDYNDNASKFSGLNPNATQSSDTVKLVKLSNYRRAITNFVKIVTKRDIPVGWAGNQSYTDGKSITLSTDIKDATFDVTVGLALHESSHIVLTDFATMKAITDGQVEAISNMIDKYCIVAKDGQRASGYTVGGGALPLMCHSSEVREFVRAMLNWIEDRRIDNYIFSTSPGYKAYYHKLYDYYWNSNDILKGFITDQFAQPGELDHWMFHIINSINPNFNVKALPRLDEVMQVIDLKNISRLQSSWESLDIACKVTDIVFDEASKYWTEPTKSKPKENEIGPGTPDADGTPQSGSGNSGSSGSNSNDPADINEMGDDDGSGTTGQNSADTNQPVLNSSELKSVANALQKQKDFLKGEVGKKAATQRLQKKLEQIAKQEIDVQQVGGDEGVDSTSTLVYDLTNSTRMLSAEEAREAYQQLQDKYWNEPYSSDNRTKLRDDMKQAEERLEETIPTEFFSKTSDRNEEAIKIGLEMGGLLGKKLQLHNESRERVDNRLRNGRIDNKRLAHAGYGIENVFNQIHVDKYKKVNLHISLDGSGSMSGSKWSSTVQMTIAIAKAAAYTQNINVQVSIRVTKGGGRADAPAILNVYDSRKNKMNHLIAALRSFTPNSMTPEGLCFEAMVKKNQFIASTSELDSYFLNISDGYPQCGNYHGSKAERHTAKWINKIKSIYNIKVLSFWMEYDNSSDKDLTAQEKYDRLLARFNSTHGDGQTFRNMYGKDASVVDSTSAIHIARELNKKFMQQA